MSNPPGIYKDWTVPQAMHVLKLICDKALNVPQAEQLGLYLPPLLEAIKRGKLGDLVEFRKAIGIGILVPVKRHICLSSETAFRVGDRFIIGAGGEVPITFLNRKWFAWFDNMRVPPTRPCVVQVDTPTEDALDKDIISEIGNDVVETNPGILWLMMKNGDLSKDKKYFFYMKDKCGTRRVVYVYGYDVGWALDAYAVPSPNGWGPGCHVVSRKPCVSQV